MYRTELQVIRALVQEYGEPELRSANFHAYMAAPRELRMFFAMRLLESEIANGGLAQFLWNAYYHWKPLCDDCSFGYSLIGADVQAAAMPTLIKALSDIEQDCGSFVIKAVANPQRNVFSEWYEVGEVALHLPEENLFLDHDGLAKMKERWLRISASTRRPEP